MTTSSNTHVLVAEQLYDTLGRPACKTVTTASPSANSLGFVNEFVTPRDPMAAGNTWINGGPFNKDSLVTKWVNKTSFPTPQDRKLAYSGQYFETDPVARLVQNSAPGEAFSRLAPANKNHTINYMSGYFPAGINTTNLLTALGLTTNNLALTQQLNSNGNTAFLGSNSIRSQAGIQDFLNRPVANISADANNNMLLTSLTYQMGAQLSIGLPPSQPVATTQTPIMMTQKTFLPNYFDSSVKNPTNFYLTNQINVLGQLVYQNSPDTGSVVCFYDAYGRLRFSQNADQQACGVVIYYLYDVLNRLIQIGFYTAAWNISNFQTATANISAATPPTGAVADNFLEKRIYDQYPAIGKNPAATSTTTRGKLLAVISQNTLTNWSNSQPTITINPESLLIEVYSYNDLGQIIQVRTINYETNYSYTSTNNIQKITYADNFVVTYAYNIQNLVSGIGYTGNNDTNYLLTYAYNASGQVVAESMASENIPVITRYLRHGNPLQQLTKIIDSKDLFSEKLIYTNDKGNRFGIYQDGNIQSCEQTYGGAVNATTATVNFKYTYNAWNWLLSAICNESASNAWSFSNGAYDSDGNIKNISLGADGSLTYTYANNQLTTVTTASASTLQYTYSPSGLMTNINNAVDQPALTNAYYYDQKTSLPVQVVNTKGTVTTTINFIYDSNGERYQKTVTINSISYGWTYIRGLGANTLIEYNNNNNEVSAHYIYGPLGLACINIPQGNDYFILRDYLGSTRVTYNLTTALFNTYYTYDSVGNVVETNDNLSSTNFRYLYTGQEWDNELQTYNYHARQYDAQYAKRFLTPDPAHQFASPYVYCGNNPVNAVDPNGKILQWAWGMISGFTRRVSRSLLPSDTDINNTLTRLRNEEAVQSNITHYPNGRAFAGPWPNLAIANLERDRWFVSGIINHISQSASVDEYSQLLFHSAGDDVAFAGIYHYDTNKIYLHPLEPDSEYHLNEFNWRNFEEKIYGRVLEPDDKGLRVIKSIKHSRQGSSGKTSHAQIREMYNLPKGSYDTVGFSIRKKTNGNHLFNGQSNTLNNGIFYNNGHRINDSLTYYLSENVTTGLMEALNRQLF